MRRCSQVRALLILMSAVALGGAGCGQLAAPSHVHAGLAAASRAPDPTRTGPDLPQAPARPVRPVAAHRAIEFAQRMLASAIVPPGSRALVRLRNPHIADPGLLQIACNPFEDVTEWWVVPGSPGRVAAFLNAHVPHGMTVGVRDGHGTIHRAPGPEFESDLTAGMHLHGALDFTFAAVGRKTKLRVDAVDVPVGAFCVGIGYGQGTGPSPTPTK
jgi:hypothetical protein